MNEEEYGLDTRHVLYPSFLTSPRCHLPDRYQTHISCQCVHVLSRKVKAFEVRPVH